jgi:cbb3-type cytochrome oxidase maturation protein
MESLFILIPLGLLLMGAAGWAFLWASRTGQFEDLEMIGRRMPDQEEDDL